MFHTQGHEVIAWIEKHCLLTAADYVGKPFVLMPWQRQLLLELFEVERDERMAGGWRRVHRWALIGIPKKNGKTELAAALALYFLIADDEGAPLIICGAASDQQADLVFGAAKTMCEMSPSLRDVTETFRTEILVRNKVGAKLKRVAAAAGTNDGANIHVCVLDELHEWAGAKGRSVWTVLTNGTGARKQPMILQITTAGSDEESIGYEQYAYGCQVREGVVDDPRYYFYWIEPADEAADYTDPELWQAVNPSWGLILQREFYEDQLGKKRESEFRRYFLNQWTEQEDIWEAASLWDGLIGRPVFEEAEPLYVAIDIGRRNDTSAVVWVQWNDGVLHVGQRIWENPFAQDDPRRSQWRLNTVEVENFLRELFDRFPVPAAEDEEEGEMPGPAFFYDPHFFHRSAETLEGEGMNMVEFPQTDARMVPASQRLFELIKGGQLVHDGDPSMRRHVRSVVAKEKERGWRISKPTGSRKHIDGAVALAMAAFEATQHLGDDDDGDGFNVW